MVFGTEARVLISVLCCFEELECTVRGKGDSANSALEHFLCDADSNVPLDRAFDLAWLVRALDFDRAREHSICPPQRVFKKTRGSKHRVGDPELKGFFSLKGAVVLEWVLDDDFESVLDTDEVR